jgi:hypothetical protein
MARATLAREPGERGVSGIGLSLRSGGGKLRHWLRHSFASRLFPSCYVCVCCRSANRGKTTPESDACDDIALCPSGPRFQAGSRKAVGAAFPGANRHHSSNQARLSRGQGKMYLSSWKLSYRTLLLFRANSAFGRHSTCTKSATRKIRRRRPRGSRRSRFAPATPSALARSRKKSLRHCAGDCTFLCIECLTNALVPHPLNSPALVLSSGTGGSQIVSDVKLQRPRHQPATIRPFHGLWHAKGLPSPVN